MNQVPRGGIVYILTNEAMPDLIKIGLTYDLKKRLRDLYTSGGPQPFQCYYAASVADHEKTERALHKAFGPDRINPSREFFRMDPDRAQAILELLAIEDVTPREDVELEVDPAATTNWRAGASQFRFASVSIPVGATLTFVKDESLTASVVNDVQVVFDGEIVSLSKAARAALLKLGYNWSAAQGPKFWKFNGRTLSSLKAGLADERRDDG